MNIMKKFLLLLAFLAATITGALAGPASAGKQLAPELAPPVYNGNYLQPYFAYSFGDVEEPGAGLEASFFFQGEEGLGFAVDYLYLTDSTEHFGSLLVFYEDRFATNLKYRAYLGGGILTNGATEGQGNGGLDLILEKPIGLPGALVLGARYMYSDRDDFPMGIVGWRFAF